MGGSCSSSSGSVYLLFCNYYVFEWARESLMSKYRLETIVLIVTLLYFYNLQAALVLQRYIARGEDNAIIDTDKEREGGSEPDMKDEVEN